jgi:hypothetical protein
VTVPGGDRALQDALIRFLADAPFRAAVADLNEGESCDGVPAEHVAMLRAAHGERVRRFSRFLARQYYHARLTHFHRYSRALACWTRRHPEAILRSPEFDALLPTLVLGSREAARDVAALLERYLVTPDAPPYTAELVRYQNAQLMAEAGSRVWRSDERYSPLDAASTPMLDTHAMLMGFEWDLPALFPILLDAARAPQHPPSPPAARRAAFTLLFARSLRGRVSVLRCSPALTRLLAALDGKAAVATAADAAGIALPEAVAIVNELAEAGALYGPGGIVSTT